MNNDKSATIEWWVDDMLTEMKALKNKGVTKKDLLLYLDSWESTLRTIKTITNKDKKMSKARFMNLLKGSSVGIFLSDNMGRYP